MIAALFVQSGGCYFGVRDIDPWDKDRDARNYDGPHPVIAHPPCQLWGKFAIINWKRWGGEHNRPGNDGGCFEKALEFVRRFGGVLEHPAHTYAWAAHGLTAPPKNTKGWTKIAENEFVCEVWQSAYGHECSKKTWLFYCGSNLPHDLRWNRPVGKFQIGRQDQRGKSKNKPTISGKRASATPVAFRNELIALASASECNTVPARALS